MSQRQLPPSAPVVLAFALMPVIGHAILAPRFHLEFDGSGRIFRRASPRAGPRLLADGDRTVRITGDVPIKDLKNVEIAPGALTRFFAT